MKKITGFKFVLIVLIFISSYSYAACDESASLYRSIQSVFVYANYSDDKSYLLDREKRIYFAVFQDNKMTLQKISDFDSLSFFHFNKRKGFMWLASNTWWEDSNKYLKKTIGEKTIDFDTILDLSVSNNEMTLFLGDFPRYVSVGKDNWIQIKDWPFLDKGDYFLGGYSVGGTFIVLVAHDEKVYFYQSNDGDVWEKSDFSMPSFVRGYLYNNLLWVVNDQGEKYSSIDGLTWQKNLQDKKFNQYVKEHDTHRDRLLNDLQSSNYIIHSIDGDQHEGVVTGSCYKRVGSNIENKGFLLRYKDSQYTMYEDFDNEKPLTFMGKSWTYPAVQ